MSKKNRPNKSPFIIKALQRIYSQLPLMPDCECAEELKIRIKKPIEERVIR